MQLSFWHDEEWYEVENERVYKYLCTYLSNFIQPPLYTEIMDDLGMTKTQLMEILGRLEKANRVHPNSTMAKGCH